MNTVLQYDVTELQVSHNDDGTMRVVFTVPDCPIQLFSEDEIFCKRDLHTQPQQLSPEKRKTAPISQVAHTRHEHVTQLERTNTTSLQAASILGERVFIEPLSTREQEVLEVLVQGASNQEIAQALVIAPNTVKRHVQAILAKLGVSNRTQAATRALQLELLEQKSAKAS